jgi:hypothetical protein
VHLGLHEHPVKASENLEFKVRACTLIGEQVERALKATNFAIVMEATKELVEELLLYPKGAPAIKFDLKELVPIVNKCKYMSSPSIQNNLTMYRYLRRLGVIDDITMLRGCSHWTFVQRNMLPGQGSDSEKVFVLKMSKVGPGSSVDLVK